MATKKRNPYKLDAKDVCVKTLPLDECMFDGCQQEATCYVEIDFRNIGMKIMFGGDHYCARHATVTAQRIKEGI